MRNFLKSLSIYRVIVPRRVETAARRVSRLLVNGNGDSCSSFDRQDIDVAIEKADVFLNDAELSPIGTVERSRQILKIIEESYPTHRLSAAYFENLSAVLEPKQTLAEPGKLVIGLGTGRSGSTTLTAYLGAIDGVCSTHENPPLVFWRPEPEQIAFHLRRFSVLLRYHPVVVDVAHWWINLVDVVLSEFPSAKFIGLVRGMQECAASFARTKGFGIGSYNHWVHHPNDIWRPAEWDPTYPTFESPAWAARQPDRAKQEMILRYLQSYNMQMSAIGDRFPGAFLMMRTESLSDLSALNELYNFVGVKAPPETSTLKLNVRSTNDGQRRQFKF